MNLYLGLMELPVIFNLFKQILRNPKKIAARFDLEGRTVG